MDISGKENGLLLKEEVVMAVNVPSLKKGEQYWCFQRHFTRPMLGTIICLTTTPGKLIGLQFEEELPAPLAHLDCDGRGKRGYCAWSHPNYLYTKESLDIIKDKFKNMTLGLDHEIDELPLVSEK